MIKEIIVCDFCGKESSLTQIDGYGLCSDCTSVWCKAIERAITKVQKEVSFSVSHRLTLLALVKNNADEKYWGSEGLKMREGIILSLTKI